MKDPLFYNTEIVIKIIKQNRATFILRKYQLSYRLCCFIIRKISTKKYRNMETKRVIKENKSA